MYSLVIRPLAQPIERMMAMSLHCSYKLPVMELDREKKQMNMVIMITTLKIVSRVNSA